MRHLALTLLATTTLASCSSQREPTAAPAQTYEVRGVVARLPDGPGTELMISHEAIPDFVNVAGDTVGMNAMTMGFPVAEQVDLEGFVPGDSVLIRFEVRWGQPKPLQLTRMERR